MTGGTGIVGLQLSSYFPHSAQISSTIDSGGQGGRNISESEMLLVVEAERSRWILERVS
jgi:hypothetical protein